MEHVNERLRYRLLTGTDNKEFCARVTEALDEGYELYGSPTMTFDGEQVLVAQAVVLPAYAAGHYRRTDS